MPLMYIITPALMYRHKAIFRYVLTTGLLLLMQRRIALDGLTLDSILLPDSSPTHACSYLTLC